MDVKGLLFLVACHVLTTCVMHVSCTSTETIYETHTTSLDLNSNDTVTSSNYTSSTENSTEEMSAAVTSSEETSAAVISTEETSAAVISTEDTSAAVPSTEETSAAVISTEETSAAVTSTEETSAAVISTEKTSAAVISTEETSAAVISTEKTSAAVTSTKDTPTTVTSASINSTKHSSASAIVLTTDNPLTSTRLTTLPSNNTTVSAEVSTIQTTTTQRHRKINLEGSTVDVKRVVIVNDTFNKSLENTTSNEYKRVSQIFNDSLTLHYSELLPHSFVRISNITFENGSIKCHHALILHTPTTELKAKYIVQALTNQTLLPTNISDFTVETAKKIAASLNILNVSDLIPKTVCSPHEVFKWVSPKTPSCVDKCEQHENKDKCGSNGYCFSDNDGKVHCVCTTDVTIKYVHDQCDTSPLPTTKTPIPAEKFTKTDILGIAAGSGGAIVLILLIALVCVCRKLKLAKKRDYIHNYTDDIKEVLQRENSQIENVPNLQPVYPNSAYNSDQGDMQMQRFEPDGRNAGHHYNYEKDSNPYRKIDEPDVGNVVIYQPSLGQSTRMDQSGRNPYSMIEPGSSYKIRRPILDRNVPYV